LWWSFLPELPHNVPILGVSFIPLRTIPCNIPDEVSITAAARRMVELSSEHCALVATEEGRVAWQDRNEYYWRMTTRGQEVRPGTFAAGVYDGEDPNPAPERVDPHAWINEGVEDGLLLVESTHAVLSQNQVLSLLWAPEYEEGYR